MTEVTNPLRKKGWECTFPGCNSGPKTKYNCYSHVWDSHLRHLSACPMYGGQKGEVYKKLTDRTTAKRQCEVYMLEVFESEEDKHPETTQLQTTVVQSSNVIPNDVVTLPTAPEILDNTLNGPQTTNYITNAMTYNLPSTHSLSQQTGNNGSNAFQQNTPINTLNTTFFQSSPRDTSSSTAYMNYVLDSANEQAESLLQYNDFISVIQLSADLKRLRVAGQIFAENGFLQRSDARVKEHIVPLQKSLEKVLQLTGKSYKYIGSNNVNMGFIAQEVKEIFPELVHEDEDGLSVDVIGMVPLLVESLKEIHTAISASKIDNVSKIEELTKATDEAMETITNVYDEIKKFDQLQEAESLLQYNFSMGPAIVTLVFAVILTMISIYVAFALPKLPGMWVYTWTVTILMWASCWRKRNELTQTIKSREVVLYWEQENWVSNYIFLFLGILALGMSVIMGNSIIALTIVIVSVFLAIGFIGLVLNKRFQMSFCVIFTVLVLFFVVVCVVVGVLFIIQPDFRCSIHHNQGETLLKVQLNEKSQRLVVNELPWNCWSSSFEFNEALPDGFYGVTNSDESEPFLEGTTSSNFPTSTVSVYLKCVDYVKFYCGDVKFQTCSGRIEKDDCIGNGCLWKEGVCI
ncbi:hypothetical protein EIN_184800 [Entamoeba invadens IP1]|uniref:hypothetical protein n=1 Tax=Entamoeba invadens IP1 TaxID=370355 RepID=UPI0002C3E57F|nr:hypothetical protein EIN_184800 [Entamoeba invadens IP1]ELP94113.1 hypothetical protein EIN_184800 [Entamoeba invadens IP1]|eukprot:XP_004260884.1 hypothetical protein EIN_184800 [Entamoeba invadens IP1]